MAKKYSSENKASVSAKPSLESSQPLFGIYGIIITIALIFILSLAGSMDNIVEKWTGLASGVIILIFLFVAKRASVLKDYITPLFYSVSAYIIWGGISTFYAASGKFAIFEFSKLLVALCVYLAVLFFTNADQAGFKKVSVILASTGCFFGIVSVDAASSGILSGIFKTIFGIFTEAFTEAGAFEQGIRITGIFNNPNTYAGFMALTVILSLYLVASASGKRNTIISVSLLAISSLSYLLAFSMGSLFMFLIACLVMIAVSEKGKRISIFLLMLETSVLTFIFAFISMLGLGKTGFVSFIPVLALVLNAVSLYFIDSLIHPAFSEKTNANPKLLLAAVLSLVVLISGYTASAFLVSGDLSLTSGENVMRGVYIPAGEYSLQVESSAPVQVTVESQNNYDLMRHTSTTLFSGNNEKDISFTVPENSKIVQVNFSAASGNSEITRAEYTGADSGRIHLNYPLLPKIIANRVQNLFANENVVQRTIFFEDGLKLFAKSPLIGRGLGGFENGAYSVQDFFYETKYTHNHYIQVLSDLGIVGIILFVSMLAFSVLSIVKAKKNSRSLYAVPVLSACLVQMFGQALTDAVWSTGVFLAFSGAILALITVFCSEPLKLKETINKNHVKLIEKTVLAVFTGVFVLLLSGNLYAQAQAKAGVESFDDIKRLIMLDRFEKNDYKLSYIINAPQANSEDVLTQAQIYAEELAKVESNSLAPYLMDFKFKVYADSDAYDIAKAGVENNRSNPAMWSRVFDILEQNVDPVGPNLDDAADRLKDGQYYIDGVVDLYNNLLERNKNSLDAISLSPYNQAFIGKCLEIQATHLYNVDWVFTAIMTYAFDSACAVDSNQDGIPDSMATLSGNVKKLDNGSFTVSDNTAVELTLYHKLHGNYRFDIEGITAQQGISITYNGTPQTVQYEKDHAYFELYLEDNSNRDLSKFVVTFPAAGEFKNITFTTKLEQ